MFTINFYYTIFIRKFTNHLLNHFILSNILEMLCHLCGILIFIICGKSLLKENFSAASPACVTSSKFIAMKEEQVPKVETEVSSMQDVKVTAAFKVDLTGDSITGSITFTFDGGRDLTNFIIKLTQTLSKRRKEKEKYYFPLNIEEKDERNKSSWHADLNCIQIPPAPSGILKAEVFQINMTSCNCDITEMVVNVTTKCTHFCHMNLVSTYSFPVAREACYIFREHYLDEVYMTLKADKIYTNFTQFRGYFTNVNPYATIYVSVFPDDYRHMPHFPLWTSLVQVTAKREIYFSVVANSLGYTRFYSKMTVFCTKDEIGDEFMSEAATLATKEVIDVKIAGDDDDSADSQDDDVDNDDEDDDDHYPSIFKWEVVFGTIVGLLSVCSVITAFVWWKILRRRRNYSPKRESLCEEAILEDGHSQTAFQTSSLYFTESKNNERYCQKGGTEPQDKKVMLVFHPDSDRHTDTVEKLILCLEKFNICVNDKPEHPFWNWRDFAEKVGEEYEDLIVVLSNGLIELCKSYRKKGSNSPVHNKRWNELSEQRNGEYIPCVVFDKLRTLVQDKCSNGKTHFVTFVDNSEDCDTVCYKKSDTVCAQVKSDTVCAHENGDTVSLHKCCETATISYQNITAHYSSGKVSVYGSDDMVCLSNNSDTVRVHENNDSVYSSNNSGTVFVSNNNDSVCAHENCVCFCSRNSSDTVYVSNNSDTVCVHESSDPVCLSNNSDTVCVNESNDTVCIEELSDTVQEVIMFDDPNYYECNSLQDRILKKGFQDSQKKSNKCSDTKNQKDFCEFFRLYTFWNPKNTYFHDISISILKNLLLSELDSHFETNSECTLSLFHILKNLE